MLIDVNKIFWIEWQGSLFWWLVSKQTNIILTKAKVSINCIVLEKNLCNVTTVSPLNFLLILTFIKTDCNDYYDYNGQANNEIKLFPKINGGTDYHRNPCKYHIMLEDNQDYNDLIRISIVNFNFLPNQLTRMPDFPS